MISKEKIDNAMPLKLGHDPSRSIVGKKNGITFSLEEDFGGEGLGDYCYQVFKVTDEESVAYIKIDGYYSSYDGATYEENYYFVEPHEKTVRDWKKI